MDDRRKRVAVLAGNYLQFKEYTDEHPEVQCVFCDKWPMFAGHEFSEVVEVGTFRKRRDALELWQRVAPMVR